MWLNISYFIYALLELFSISFPLLFSVDGFEFLCYFFGVFCTCILHLCFSTYVAPACTYVSAPVRAASPEHFSRTAPVTRSYTTEYGVFSFSTNISPIKLEPYVWMKTVLFHFSEFQYNSIPLEVLHMLNLDFNLWLIATVFVRVSCFKSHKYIR